jgi:hypothetical protein
MSQTQQGKAEYEFERKKTIVMSTVEKVNIFSDDEDTSKVTNCMYLAVITNGEIKKRISLSKAAMANLAYIIQNL